MAAVSTPANLVNVEVGSSERSSRRPLRYVAIKEINAFASYVGSQFFGANKRRQPQSNKGIGIIDFADFEEECDSPMQDPSCKRRYDRRQQTMKTLRSPRSVLQKLIPSNASQSMQMDLLLLHECPNIEDLRKCAWKGCSPKNRAQVWRLLLGHEPLEYKLRQSTLEMKRNAYREYVQLLCAPEGAAEVELSKQVKRCRLIQRQYEQETNGSRGVKSFPQVDKQRDLIEYSDYAMKTLRQIEMDLPRTHPDIPIFHVPEVRNPMRRILYLYGMLNPNKNYVQGMNELLTPVVVVFLSSYLKHANDKGVESFLSREDLCDSLTEQEFVEAEADAFWTFSLVVSCIEDNFIAEQTGILRRIARLEEIVDCVDPLLSRHLARNGNEFIQFSYRWMNCLLMRELPFTLVVKLWDALFAEEDGLGDLQVYFCAAMMTRFRGELLTKGFEDCIMFLQHLPTTEWKTSDIDVLLSQAYIWKQQLQLESLG